MQIAKASLAVLFLAQAIVPANVATAAEPRIQNAAVGSPQPPDRDRLSASAREAIFRNRAELLRHLFDPAKQEEICTPAVNASYDLFQTSLHEELDILWDLDIYASKYRLSKEQHSAVKICSRSMEQYFDSFTRWQNLPHQ